MQAIIDIGSTSVRLCFCDLEKAVNEKQVETTRLAENQTADGELWRPALIRTAEAVENSFQWPEARASSLKFLPPRRFVRPQIATSF